MEEGQKLKVVVNSLSELCPHKWETEYSDTQTQRPTLQEWRNNIQIISHKVLQT